MTDDRTLERAARSWLEEGPTRAPDHAVDAALSRIQTTRQERELRLPWRFPTVSSTTRIAALIVAIAAVGGAVSLFAGAWNGSRPSASPSPTRADPATIAELNGPWRPVPYAIPPDVLAVAEAACLTDPDMPASAQLVIADARGAEQTNNGVVVGTMGFLLPNGDFAHCSILQFRTGVAQAYIDLKGCLMLPEPTAGARCLGEVPAPPLQIVGLVRGPAEFAGKIGQGVAGVRLVFSNGLTADATVQGDWFAVYAPSESPGGSFRLLALNAFGDVVATFDPAR